MAYKISPNSLENHWMPFTDNRGFKDDPRLIASASGVYMKSHRGTSIIDGSSGLFCSPAGHCHPKIIEAVHEQMKINTYTAPFGLGHQASFDLADKVAELTPTEMNHVFFVNSGSEAIDTALKIIMAYFSAKGENRHKFVSRERAYHGVNIGGVSLAGMVNNRRTFPVVMPGVVMMRHTWTGEELNVKGQPEDGKELANDLERFAQAYGGNTIAACFVEPVAGSTGTLVPPLGYLERLREICDQYGILLVFDEVITGFGRMGTNFAADKFNVKPDIMTLAKAITNGSMPMGAVCVRDEIYETVTNQANPNAIEFFHGYTYSGHTAACAAGLATLDIYSSEGLFEKAADLSPYFIDAVHSLSDHPLVKDVRTIGLMAGVELYMDKQPGKLGSTIQKEMFWNGLHIKWTGDNGIVAPMFISERSHIDEIIGKFRFTLDNHK
jgi:beta-alanine--pyruvate transaminase